VREWMMRLIAVGRRGRRDEQLDDELRFTSRNWRAASSAAVSILPPRTRPRSASAMDGGASARSASSHRCA
jgi:hypothetical protein